MRQEDGEYLRGMAYYFKPSALKDLKRLPRILRKRIVHKLDYYSKSHNPLRFAKTMKDKHLGEYRFRVGDYRIIFDFEIKERAIIVLAVGHRKNIYK